MGFLDRFKRTAGFPPADPAQDPAQQAGMPGQPPSAEPGPEVHHCPLCASGSVTGAPNGDITCGFCQAVFRVFMRPQHPSMPRTIDGQPYTGEGMPANIEDPVPAAGGAALPGDPTAGPLPGAGPAGGIEQFRVDGGAPAVPGAAPGAAQGIERFRTAAGFSLDRPAYVRHIALAHAAPHRRTAVLRQVRAAHG